MNSPKIGLVGLSVFFILLWMIGCDSAKNSIEHQEYIEVYYLKGFVDAAIYCSKKFSPNEADSLEAITIKNSDYQRMLRYLDEVKDVPEESSSCTMYLQGNFRRLDSVKKRLCINVFNCTILDDKQVAVNDSLIYLLRYYSGYYNYFERDRLDIFRELETFGVPSGYKDLSESDSSNKVFAKIILKPEE